MPYLLTEQYAATIHDILQHIDTEQQSVDVNVHDAIAHEASHLLVRGLGTLEKAQAQEISFLTNSRYTQQLLTTQATWVVLHPQTVQRALELQPREQYPSAWIVCNHPYLLYAKIAQWFAQKLHVPSPISIHPTAVVDSSAVLGAGVVIGPHVVIEAQVQIEEHVRIEAGCFIGRQAKIGAYTHLRPRVTIYHEVVLGHHVNIHSGSVIGADGFGFAPDKRTEDLFWEKIPQFGTVLIGNYVDIGANTTIDRGALENTIIGDRAILDNQIQIAHNVQVGEATAIAGCAAIAGSSTIGKNCILGGGSQISGHLTIADNVHVSGGTPVIGSISKPGMYTGVFPTTEHHEWEKNAVILRKLSVLRKKVIDLESQITTS